MSSIVTIFRDLTPLCAETMQKVHSYTQSPAFKDLVQKKKNPDDLSYMLDLPVVKTHTRCLVKHYSHNIKKAQSFVKYALSLIKRHPWMFIALAFVSENSEMEKMVAQMNLSNSCREMFTDFSVRIKDIGILILRNIYTLPTYSFENDKSKIESVLLKYENMMNKCLPTSMLQFFKSPAFLSKLDDQINKILPMIEKVFAPSVSKRHSFKKKRTTRKK